MNFLCIQAQVTKSVSTGHAHNDYAQKRRIPLVDALKKGFVSIEVDVYAYGKNDLKVAHLPFFLASKRNLEQLYFKPLEIWLRNYQKIFQDSTQELILMVDVKSRPDVTYQRLKKLCLKYKTMLSYYDAKEDSVYQKSIRIVVSGKRPVNLILQDSISYLFLDGRLQDMKNAEISPKLVPRVSMSYPFRWKGKGEIPAEELVQLRQYVQEIHTYGAKVRFWAMPENEELWTLFLQEGVDWMNIDDLDRYRQYLEKTN
ncbi:MAG: hypothetical protein MK212_09120 [Saprospiraceae bacterium]|nr:hypothetical protein [Saprospiraceae bacterium]